MIGAASPAAAMIGVPFSIMMPRRAPSRKGLVGEVSGGSLTASTTPRAGDEAGESLEQCFFFFGPNIELFYICLLYAICLYVQLFHIFMCHDVQFDHILACSGGCFVKKLSKMIKYV